MQSLFLCATILAFTCGVPLDKLGAELAKSEDASDCLASETKMNDGSCCDPKDIQFDWDATPKTSCSNPRWPVQEDCQMYGNCGAWGAANCLADEVVINAEDTDCSRETCCKAPEEFKQLLHKSCSKSKLSRTKYRSARSAQSACKLEGHKCRGYYVSGCDLSATTVYYKLCNPKAYTESSSSCVFDKADKDGCYVESNDGTDLKAGEWVPGCSYCTFDECQDKARELTATYLAYTDTVYNGFCKVQMENVTDPDLTTDQGYNYKLFWFNANQQCSDLGEVTI